MCSLYWNILVMKGCCLNSMCSNLAILAKIFLFVAFVGSLCGIFWLEYFGRLIVWAASTGIFWLSAAPVCQVVLACFVNLSQKPPAEKVTNNQPYSVARARTSNLA